MNYYKIIENGTVIDANCIFLKWQKKNNILIGCDASEANFIQSSDQQKVWKVDWLIPADAKAGEYPSIEAVEITKEEYDELRAQLDAGLNPEVPEEEPEIPSDTDEPGDEVPSESVMSVEEMRRKITMLETALEEQKIINGEQMERNDFLEGCLLEMSEIVYG